MTPQQDQGGEYQGTEGGEGEGQETTEEREGSLEPSEDGVELVPTDEDE